MRSPQQTWDDLAAPWHRAFDEAWASFQQGSFGVGAVLTDPQAANIVVSIGRNRVGQAEPGRRMLSGNMMAHAEMNAFAGLDAFNADGLRLYTTLQPCLMCAATAMQLKVERVDYAADDEFFDGLDDLWAMHPLTAQRKPTSSLAFSGPMAAFARLLPMMFTLERFPGRSADRLARAQHPELVGVIERLDQDATWAQIRTSGTCLEALHHLWPGLPHDT